MLYDLWRQAASAQPAGLALWDFKRRERWTFCQLAELVERDEPSSRLVAFPQGTSADFVISVLRAWRAGQVTCPLESGQSSPTVSNLPKGIVHLKTTSATTGAARLVGLTASQLIADCDNIISTMGLRPDWPNVAVISLAHSYGFSNLITPLVLRGIPLLLAASPLPESLRQAASSVPAVTVPGVPALWRAWHEAKTIPQNIRLAISAGAPLPLPLEESIFQQHALKIHNFYGATECGGIAYDASTSPRADASLVGAALRNVNLSTNADGCLEVRGSAVAETYLPEALPALGDGCYRTLDLAEIKDGVLYLRGRMGDLINVAGRKVAPEQIERALLAHAEIKDCLVFGVPSGVAGRADDIVACVAGRSELTAESLKHYLLKRLPDWQLPRDWWFVETLAPNQRGKLSRAEWREKYLQNRRER